MTKKVVPQGFPRIVPRAGHIGPQIRRVGMPARPLKDIYHVFLRISWPALFAVFGILYVAINALFGALYTLDDHAILNARPGSYADAFFFSVQTLATIGYGAMAPQSLYAHVLVAIEALIGVMSFAICTGLIFTKFSRPSARVMFSHRAVVTLRDGVPTLIFRAANERDSHIVDAQVRMVLTRNEVTREGEPVRRFHDLALVRNHTPIFTLSWTIMHPITEISPLYGQTAESLAAARSEIVVTFVGLDDLTLQQVHARHSYIAEEIHFGHRLVDILGTNSQGDRTVNYRRFHDVEPTTLASIAPP